MAYHFDTFDNIDDFAVALIEHVSNEKISVTWTVEPDRKEIRIEPWVSYHPVCPYAVKEERCGKHETK